MTVTDSTTPNTTTPPAPEPTAPEPTAAQPTAPAPTAMESTPTTLESAAAGPTTADRTVESGATDGSGRIETPNHPADAAAVEESGATDGSGRIETSNLVATDQTAERYAGRSAGAGVGVALACHDLHVSFNETEALKGVDLQLATGEWLGLIGPNGAGKSTLLRAVAGLVSFEGSTSVANGQPPAATDVALVPQHPALPEGMTVAEYAMLGRSPHLSWLATESRRDRRIVASVLERLHLASFADRPVTRLSGGETQRVVLARALVQQAPVLLLDEPTSALDLGHRAAVMELIDELRRSDGISVIAAMHDLGTAARFADRLVLIHEGRLVTEGAPRDVLNPDRLSAIYDTPLNVHSIDGELVVLPAPRSRQKDGAALDVARPGELPATRAEQKKAVGAGDVDAPHPNDLPAPRTRKENLP